MSTAKQKLSDKILLSGVVASFFIRETVWQPRGKKIVQVCYHRISTVNNFEKEAF